MSPSTTGADDVLNEDNDFAWEFNARMKLAKKVTAGSHGHNEVQVKVS